MIHQDADLGYGRVASSSVWRRLRAPGSAMLAAEG